MPKARKSKKIKAKKKAKKRNGKKKAPAVDERVRGLVEAMVNRFGASVAEVNGDRMVIAQFNKHPFVIDLATCQVEDIDVGKPSEPANVIENTIATGEPG